MSKPIDYEAQMRKQLCSIANYLLGDNNQQTQSRL